MLSLTQCQISKVMTGSKSSNSQIITEFENASLKFKKKVFEEVDKLLKMHDMPINEGLGVMRDDFCNIAASNHIDSATLFCIYMDMHK